MTQPTTGRGGKSRIVVDVARMQEEARLKKGRRFGRASRYLSVTGLVVIGLIVVLLVGSYAWWQSYKKSPAYSLALLVDAAQRDDVQTVESLIDADKIAEGFIPQVIEKLAGANSNVPPAARAQLTNALPQLLPRVREGVRDQIAASMKSLSKNASGSVPFVLTALGMRSAADVREQGDEAAVVVKAGDRPIELSMRRDGERWKVVTVKDDQLVADISARLASSVPALAQPAQQPQGQPRRKGAR
ncbi:MAG TPA: hypothetical protein VEX60_04870 [Pyrinomonadaceae bacterium]|nr:hypothetical protein [Pyrinomonadaceae bacterium]